jgi:hypothetical protein
MLEKDSGTTKSQRRNRDETAESKVEVEKVVEKVPAQRCGNCKWMVLRVQHRQIERFVCKNPMNFGLYDHFNPSTGDVMENIVIAPNVVKDEVCAHWEQSVA